MKVLLLTISYPPVLNSAARLFSELAESLSERGHQVTVLTAIPERYLAEKDSGNKFPQEEIINGVRVYRLPSSSLPKHIPLFRALEHVFFALRCWLKGRKLPPQDAVIVYSPPLPLGITGIRLARRWGGKAIVNVQDLYPQSVIDLGLLRNPFFISLARQMEQWVYNNADFITVHSEGNRLYVIDYGVPAERAIVVPNWIDLEKFSPGQCGNSLKQAVGLKDGFIVSYAGVMGFAQGVEDIIGAAVRLRDIAPDIYFVLVGSGVALPHLKERVQREGLSNVLFVPHLPEDKYIELLRASDICLVTLDKRLRTPVVPGKLPCIMAVGRPVICSTAPESDARRIVEEANSGLWVNAGDAKALADAVLSLYRESARREEMGNNGRTYAGTHFRRELCVEKYIRILDGFDKQ